MLDPVKFPINKSVSFFLPAIIPVIISGNAVPIATIVIPINFSDSPSFVAIDILLFTTKSDPNFSPNIPTIKKIAILKIDFSSLDSTSFIISSSIFLSFMALSSYIVKIIYANVQNSSITPCPLVIMLDIMYELPELKGYEVIITKETVSKKEKPLLIKQKKNGKKSA